MYRVVDNPRQQQNHSYDYEHGGASNHLCYQCSNNPLATKNFEGLRPSTSLVQKKFSVVPRSAASAAWLGTCRRVTLGETTKV
jgi:hypothetical protein